MALAVPRRIAVAVLALGSLLASGRPVDAAEPERLCRLPLRVRTASPVGTGGCTGVRPGAYFRTRDTGCTFNFLFRGSDGHRYMGSAGHCLLAPGDEPVDDDPPDRAAVWPAGRGPVIRSDRGAVIGEGAFAIQADQRDFSLIRLRRGVKASPQMCHFGGPTGLDDEASGPTLLEHYGQGNMVREVAPGRTAFAVSTEDAVVRAFGVANFGDSGSGVLRTGRALGVLVALTVGVDGNMYITRLAPQLDEAERALRIRLRLQTAPRL